MAAADEPTEIIIPVADSHLAVCISFDALPEDESEVVMILQAEQAPLRLWIEFANAYLANGKVHQCKRMLEDGCHPGARPAPARQRRKIVKHEE